MKNVFFTLAFMLIIIQLSSCSDESLDLDETVIENRQLTLTKAFYSSLDLDSTAQRYSLNYNELNNWSLSNEEIRKFEQQVLNANEQIQQFEKLVKELENKRLNEAVKLKKQGFTNLEIEQVLDRTMDEMEIELLDPSLINIDEILDEGFITINPIGINPIIILPGSNSINGDLSTNNQQERSRAHHVPASYFGVVNFELLPKGLSGGYTVGVKSSFGGWKYKSGIIFNVGVGIFTKVSLRFNDVGGSGASNIVSHRSTSNFGGFCTYKIR